ncbi:MAG: nucleotidyltransferase domain-containing protein [Candidatus Thermoplasmatota archaeon]|nr:nucleotidyltransferase domain-containing protein [Candidatus Thermoplasmatota archaeon]
MITGKVRSRLEDMYGQILVDVILYGSQARGDSTVDSDIDLAVILDKDLNK